MAKPLNQANSDQTNTDDKTRTRTIATTMNRPAPKASSRYRPAAASLLAALAALLGQLAPVEGAKLADIYWNATNPM